MIPGCKGNFFFRAIRLSDSKEMLLQRPSLTTVQRGFLALVGSGTTDLAKASGSKAVYKYGIFFQIDNIALF